MLPSLLAISAQPVGARNTDGTIRGKIDAFWILVIIVVAVLIGLRVEVGGDWFNYLKHFKTINGLEYADALSRPELSHWIINKAMFDLGLGVTGANLIYGFLFAIGLISFSRVQPRPWLVLACAVPYLIIVVGMGYSRQAVALGFALIGLVALRRGRFIRFSLWVLVGVTFHTSAIFLIFLAGIAVTRNRLQAIAIIAVFSIVGYEVFLANRIHRLFEIYVQLQLTSSEGALIRLSMNALAGVVFLYCRGKIILSTNERRIWTFFSLVALAMFICYFATGLSTALDRMALYIIPLQLVTLAHLPDVFGSDARRHVIVIGVILLYYFTVLLVWLNFANHAAYWLPYRLGFSS